MRECWSRCPRTPAGCADDYGLLAHGAADAALVARLERRVGLLPGRGACRHPDGASRLAATDLRTFAEDVRRHLAPGPCRPPGAPGALAVPEPVAPADRDWR